jgi:RNA polymerase sigma-70 factor (ECF subfamily)
LIKKFTLARRPFHLFTSPPAAHPVTSDHAAFTALYRQHMPTVYRYALARLGSIPDAQDIASQTFLAAFAQFHQYQGRARVSSWLLGIASHKVIDRVRQQQKQVSLDEMDADPLSGLNLEVSIEHTLDIERAIRTMQDLSPDRREALSLHVFGELSIQETADVMGRSYAATQMLIQRGLTDLRTRLQEDQ